jgi:hypothetical protein
MDLEPPYGAIARAFRYDRVVPFLGAGVNHYGSDVGPDVSRTPSGSELSKALAALSMFPADTAQDLSDLAKVASYYVESSGRRSLREMLHETFNKDFTPCKIHEYLADLPHPLLIVTTNYDDLTERAFEAKNRAYDVVVHPTDRTDMAASVLWWKHGTTSPEPHPPNSLPMIERLETTTVIYKMHGTVVRPWFRRAPHDPRDQKPYRDDSYVITEEDYIDFLHRMTLQAAVPTQFMTYFSSRQFLFLGYGLRDWNLRVVLKNLNAVLRIQDTVKNEEDDDPSWAIQYQPSLLERKLWERRRVDIYNLDVNEFVTQLRKF